MSGKALIEPSDPAPLGVSSPLPNPSSEMTELVVTKCDCQTSSHSRGARGRLRSLMSPLLNANLAYAWNTPLLVHKQRSES
jgi:hypothetical protein